MLTWMNGWRKGQKRNTFDRRERTSWYFTTQSLRLISISFQLQACVLHVHTHTRTHTSRNACWLVHRTDAILAGTSITWKSNFRRCILGGLRVELEGGWRSHFKYTHLSWQSAFDSCELFYSHVTDCIKRTSGNGNWRVYRVSPSAVYNEFTKVIPRRVNLIFEHIAVEVDF